MAAELGGGWPPGAEPGDGGSDSGSGSDAEVAGGADTLSLVGEGLTAVPAGLAARAPPLRRLCLHGNAIAASAGLAGLGSLRELNLSSNCIAALPDGALAGLTSLTSLSLASNGLAALGPGALAGLPRLRRLALAHNALASLAGLAPLQGGPLEWLDLRDNGLASLAELAVLAGLPRLAELRLAGAGSGAPRRRGLRGRRACLRRRLLPLLLVPLLAHHLLPSFHFPLLLQATRCAPARSIGRRWRQRCRACACWTARR